MEHPIENLMKTAMTNLKEMVDVNTIVGSPVSTADGNVVLTVSQVALVLELVEVILKGISLLKNITVGKISIKRTNKGIHLRGSGAGVSISPVAF